MNAWTECLSLFVVMAVPGMPFCGCALASARARASAAFFSFDTASRHALTMPLGNESVIGRPCSSRTGGGVAESLCATALTVTSLNKRSDSCTCVRSCKETDRRSAHADAGQPNMHAKASPEGAVCTARNKDANRVCFHPDAREHTLPRSTQYLPSDGICKSTLPSLHSSADCSPSTV